MSQQPDATLEKVHAEGYLSFEAPSTEYESLKLEDVFARCTRMDLTGNDFFLTVRLRGHYRLLFIAFYEDLKSFAEYGPAFQRVVDGYQGENEVLVLVRGLDDVLE